MLISIPGQTVKLRFFERVETKDEQYDIFDVGTQQEDGSIDSLVVGGSFSLIKSLAADADAKLDKEQAEKREQAKTAVEEALTEEPAAA